MSIDESSLEKPRQEWHTQTVCLLVLVAVSTIYMIYWLRPILVPLVVAFFVVSGVGPVLDHLVERLHVSRMIAAVLAFVGGVLLLVVFGSTIWVSMLDLAKNSDAYRARIGELVVEIDEHIPIELSASVTPAVETERSLSNAGQFVDSFVRDGITLVSEALISLVSTSVVVLIYVYFLLIGTPSLGGSPTVEIIDNQIRAYLSLKTVISILTGLAFGVALWLFGVPMAFTFGVLAFLLNFIPNIGPIVASLLPMPLILLDPEGSVIWMVCTITVISSIQLISGNIIEPKLMGESSDLHPVTVLVALMFWGMMWGIIGMFLATPITAAMRIVFERFEYTQGVADLMAGRWREQPAG